MDRGLVSPEWEPLVKLLHSVLERIAVDLAEFGPVNLSVSTGSGEDILVLASLGEGPELLEAQILELGGPLPDAVATGLPIAVVDVWSDSRWPQLTREAVTALKPHLRATWARIQGMAVMPAGHDEHSMVALSCALPGPANELVLDVLASYRQLLESAIAVTRATSVEGPDNVLRMLQSRALIEQAKGAITAAAGCDTLVAWRILRAVSQRENVKLRDIATALVELVGQTEAEYPEGLPTVSVDPAARRAASELWKNLRR